MAKVFMDAKDKNVSTTMIYTSDFSNFFYDKEKTKPVDMANDSLELFLKGVVLCKLTNGELRKAVRWKSNKSTRIEFEINSAT